MAILMHGKGHAVPALMQMHSIVAAIEIECNAE